MAKKTSQFTKEVLETLRGKLPEDWREKLADITGFTTGYVENIMYGTVIKDSVVVKAMKMAEDYKLEMALVAEKINNL